MGVSRQLQGMFVLLFVGYLVTVYLRQAVSFASPTIMESEQLKNSDIGLMLSSQMTGYMVVKFLGGTLVDVLDPGLTLSVSLCLAGLAAAAFTAQSSVVLFAGFWFLCGVAQGPAWAACGVMLKKNFPSDQLATWWSVLSTSTNVAGTAGPLVSGFLIYYYNWKTAMLVASSASVGLGLLCFLFLKSPTQDVSTDPGTDSAKDKSVRSGSVRDLLTPVPVTVYLTYLLVTVVRGACNDWGQLYLIQDKGQSVGTGSGFISSQEIGGIVGSLITGIISDYLVAKHSGRTTPRLYLVLSLTVLQTASLYLFVFHVSAQSSQVWISALAFCVGFSMYSCISLLGICSMEVAPESLSGTAHSMAALGGNIGRVLAGYPLSVVATWWSWQESFYLALAFSVASVAVTALGCKLLKDRYRRREEEEKKLKAS
ncbi:glucose-6-phosphate exchanger SLC37A4 [Aplysia californica]|uniref:Glucose-6-phosphate exchanger SLC37A4 n=1 Tax=Aplysia californica TaxID=6500 RepID=A0ABM0K767_APLCA|nr:glucose-6-phosphate exchanger SLC37A4 [Aplysia californica]